MNQSQLSLPVEVRPEEIARKQTLGAAIELCAELGGHALDKTLQQELEVDKAQFSRWQSGTEGIVWPKFERLMDACGNDAPLLWMLHKRGYDLHSLRRQETEYQKQARLAKEREEAAERRAKDAEEKVRFLTQIMQGKAAA